MSHTELDLGNMIQKELERQERSIAWLAGKIGCHRSTLARMLQKRSIDSSILHRISIELNVDYHAFYSRRLQK
jgi:plasmid maintenance system antidote protein VapI